MPLYWEKCSFKKKETALFPLYALIIPFFVFLFVMWYTWVQIKEHEIMLVRELEKMAKLGLIEKILFEIKETIAFDAVLTHNLKNEKRLERIMMITMKWRYCFP